MEDTQTNEAGSSALPYFLAGLGVGIAVMALLAPQSGAETRRIIRGTIRKGEKWVKSTAAAVEDSIRNQGDELGDRVKEASKEFGRW